MFKNPIAPRVKEKKEKNPWNFTAPCYDYRNMQSAGDFYGTGFNQPIGHKGKTKSSVDVLPMGKVKTMQDDNMPENRIPMYGQKSRY
jgi:hypothetical protein